MLGAAPALLAVDDGVSGAKVTTPALARVARGALCSGCGGCTLAAPGRIRMERTAPGFLRPRQEGPVSREEDRRIARICPGLGQRLEAGERRDDVLWGPYLEMRTGWATDAELRHRASSGGALSAFLAHLLETGQVDGVVQVTADPALPVGNATVLSESVDAVAAAAGSRYAPSAPVAALAPYLDGEGRYAFVGKPCDVVAFRALAAEDPRFDARFPFVLSFFCAGVPSQAGAEEVLAALGVTPDEVAAFRYRGMGWPGRATATLKAGGERSMTYHESWGGILSHHVQHRCKICPDGTGDAADLVCADAWECDEQGYPIFEEGEGTSLIVARTEKGRQLLGAAEAAGRVETRPFDAASLPAIQPGQYNRRRVLLARLAGLAVSGKPVPRYRGLHLRAAARHASRRMALRNFLGMVRRVARGRLGG